MRRDSWWGVGAAAVLLVTASLLLAWYRLGLDRTVVFWDHALFLDHALDHARRLREAPLAGFFRSLRSLAGDGLYGFITLPLGMVMTLGSATRTMFTLATVGLYHTAYAACCGLIATGLITDAALRRKAFVATFSAAAVQPLIWATTLEGFPDTASAALLAGALAVLLRDPRLDSPRSSYAVGALLGLAVACRRYFMHSAVTVGLLVVGLQILRLVRPAPATSQAANGSANGNAATAESSISPTARLREGILRIARLAAMALAVLILFANKVIIRLATDPFSGEFEAYKLPTGADSLRVMWDFVGLSLPLGLLGYGLMLLHRRINPGRTAMLLAGFTWWCVFWAYTTRYASHHQAVGFLGIVPAVGLGLLLTELFTWPGRLRMVTAPLAALLAALLVWNIWAAAGLAEPVRRAYPWTTLQALAYPPQVRSDFSQLQALATAIARESGDFSLEPQVYVPAASAVVNTSIVQGILREFAPSARVAIANISDVDRRDVPPLCQLLGAELVVTAQPVQIHLRPDLQKNLIFPTRLLADDPVVTSWFRQAGDFRLGEHGEVAVRLLRRIRQPSPQEALALHARMVETFGPQEMAAISGFAVGNAAHQSKGSRRLVLHGTESLAWPNPLATARLTAQVAFDPAYVRELHIQPVTVAADGAVSPAGQELHPANGDTVDVAAPDLAAGPLALQVRADFSKSATTQPSVTLRFK